MLESLRMAISRCLFEERAALSPADVTRLVQQINDNYRLVEDFADDAASCMVNAPDFSPVTVFLSWYTLNSNWNITCTVAAEYNWKISNPMINILIHYIADQNKKGHYSSLKARAEGVLQPTIAGAS